MKKYALVYLLSIGCLLLILGACKNSGKKETYIRKLERNKESIAVGIYKPNESDVIYTRAILEALKIDGGIVAVSLNNEDIKRSKLENIDVFILPGFRSNCQLTIDQELIEILRRFSFERGKGIVAISSGSKMITGNENKSRGYLIDLKMIAPQPGETLNGIMKFELSDRGKQIFPELKHTQNLFIDFQSGPIIDMESGNGQNIQLMGSKFKANAGIPFFVTAQAGKGRIFITAAHPEITPGMRWILPRMVRWTIGRDLVSYDQNVVRPGFFKQEFIIDEESRKEIDELITKLVEGDKSQKISAMDQLYNTYPWMAAEKVVGLLSDSHEKVRLKAAEFLTRIEYTPALPDLEKAVQNERKRRVKDQLLAYENEMCNMIEQQVSVN
ncbi:MAG: hypothetical protein V2I54_14200 [Bacteroidales bacterium]|jgi:hypothetical protein|nr:hypothetical protein [Bacteroidales bacterium]